MNFPKCLAPEGHSCVVMGIGLSPTPISATFLINILKSCGNEVFWALGHNAVEKHLFITYNLFMMVRKKYVLIAVLLIYQFFLSAREAEENKVDLTGLEKQLIFLINRDRGISGLPALSPDPVLVELARSHSHKMNEENRLSHYFDNYPELDVRANEAGLFFLVIGENIARSDTLDITMIHDSLMNSPGHRGNILNHQFSQIGLGITTKENNYYVTQVFARLAVPISARRKRSTLSQRYFYFSGYRDMMNMVDDRHKEDRHSLPFADHPMVIKKGKTFSIIRDEG